MNPRVSRSSALASKATGLPHREDRRPAGGRLPARGDPQRHHPRDARRVRADPRLRGREGPAVRVREVPRGLAGARLHDEVGGRGHGDRADLPRGARQGVARHREGPLGSGWPDGRGAGSLDALAVGSEDRLHRIGAALAAGHGVDEVAAASDVDPWFVDQIARTVEEATRRPRPAALHAGRRGSAGGEAGGARRRRDRRAHRRDRGRRPTAPRRARRLARVQDRGHVRGGVPREHAVPLLDLRGDRRGAPRGAAPRGHPGRRSEPDRPGDRVRLRLRARRVRARGGRVRVRDARTRTRRRSRPTTTRPRACTSSRWPPKTSWRSAVAETPVGVIAQFGGQTPLRLARMLQEEGFTILGTSPDAIDLAEDRGKFAEVLAELDDPRAAARRGPHDGRGARGREPDRLPRRRPPVLRPGRARHGDRLRRRRARAVRPHGGRGLARPPRARRSLPRGCDRGRRGRGRRRRTATCSSAR